ncbi:MAG: cyclic nucleotide-binding domain-containing protein [Spirochaetia bacterium]
MRIDSERTHAFLKRVIPFRFLTTTERESLVGDIQLVEYDAGEDIARQGDDTDKALYLLESGLVEIYDERGASGGRVMLVEPEHYFGEWEALFDVPRFYGMRAIDPSRCYMISGERFLRLVSEARPFAQSLGVILRDQHGVFVAFERFKVELMRGIGKGYITLAQLLPLYRDLVPVMHPLVNSDELDTTALSYVVRRLPHNVTRTFAYVLTDEIPAVYRDPDSLFPRVPTEARRREVWETLPGSSLVLLRTGMSDLVDLISCLCLYAVEANKLRARLHDPNVVRTLKDWANGRTAEKDAVGALPLAEAEVEGLRRLWGEGSALQTLRDREASRDLCDHRATPFGEIQQPPHRALDPPARGCLCRTSRQRPFGP